MQGRKAALAAVTVVLCVMPGDSWAPHVPLANRYRFVVSSGESFGGPRLNAAVPEKDRWQKSRTEPTQVEEAQSQAARC